MSTRDLLMKNVEDEIVNLEKSPLYKYRLDNGYLPVIGEGSSNASLIFIGEAPGKNEALSGKPFCGASGKILDQLLNSIDRDRKKVYITNIVKDRPPENRDPTPLEIELYAPFLDRQIEIIKPKVIATLGRFSMKYLLERYDSPEKGKTIGDLHGRKIKLQFNFGEVFLIPLYHPAASIYNRKLKDTLFEDFQNIKDNI